MGKRHLIVGAAAVLAMATPLLAQRPSDYVQALMAADRPPTDLERDADRQPADEMAFAGIRPGMKIAELAPGGGYFTRLLSAAVGPGGKVYAVSTRPLPWLEAWNAKHGNVTLQSSPLPAPLAPEPVDVVWTTQNYHDFKNRPADASGKDGAAQYNAAAFSVLKPGGVYLVGDHQGAPGTGATQTSTLHRIEDATVIREVEAAGFKLAGRSEVLRHPADDHSGKVFDAGVRGKTDQFLLRFVKPRGKR
jgi:predicted methyltransferase